MRINKRWGLLSIVLLIILFCVSGGVVAIKAQNPTNDIEGVSGTNKFDIITIDNSGYEKDRKGPVEFAHKEHARDYEIFCWDCHHDYQDNQNIWSPWGTTQKCIACHDPSQKKDTAMKLQTAYHLNCKTCHIERKIFQDEPLAYRKCFKCHEKTNK